MAAHEIDDYLAALDEPKREALQLLRASILAVIPEAEQCISYRLPAFKVQGKAVAGFGAFKDHLSYFPHSGAVLAELAAELAAYDRTKGSLHFSIDEPLPPDLVERLIAVRMRNLGLALWAQTTEQPSRPGVIAENIGPGEGGCRSAAELVVRV